MELKIDDHICPHCKQTFKMNIKQFANHVRWCKSNPDYERILRSTIQKNVTRSKQIVFKCKCERCGKEYNIKCTANGYKKKKHFFCSRSCANRRGERPEDVKQKIRAGVLKTLSDKGVQLHDLYEDHKCLYCGNTFYGHYKTKYCSQKCRRLAKLADIRDRSEFDLYYKLCRFTFKLSDYPGEFDFDLLKEHGMYKAKNRGDNPDGVSRDHMYSIMDGWKNKIDPEIISHPANCKLIPQRQNASKGRKSSITIDELMSRIRDWNIKHGVK